MRKKRVRMKKTTMRSRLRRKTRKKMKKEAKLIRITNLVKKRCPRWFLHSSKKIRWLMKKKMKRRPQKRMMTMRMRMPNRKLKKDI